MRLRITSVFVIRTHAFPSFFRIYAFRSRWMYIYPSIVFSFRFTGIVCFFRSTFSLFPSFIFHLLAQFSVYANVSHINTNRDVYVIVFTTYFCENDFFFSLSLSFCLFVLHTGRRWHQKCQPKAFAIPISQDERKESERKKLDTDDASIWLL